MDNLYTVRDVAKVLGISPHTVRKWLRENRLPAIRFGRCVRFDPAAIDRFVQSHSIAAGAMSSGCRT